MPDPNHLPSADSNPEFEPQNPYRELSLEQLRPHLIAHLLGLTARDAHLNIAQPGPDNAGDVYIAVVNGLTNLIDSDVNRARAAITLAAGGTDWQQEVSASFLGQLLERDHRANDDEHVLATAALLVDVFRREASGGINPEVSRQFDGGTAGQEMIELMVENWIRPDISNWFRSELLKHFPPWVLEQ